MKTASRRWRRLTACLLAVAITVALLAILKLSELDPTAHRERDIIVRKVDVAMPPPPPPPPPLQQPTVTSNSLNLDVSGSGQAAPLNLSKSRAQADIHVEAPPVDALNNVDWNLDWDQDWNVFGLGELDQKPKLLTPIKINFPNSLKRRGIRKATVKLHVVIDESGRVTLKGIRHIDYPELRSGIHRVVRQARFTAPTKGGQPVRAEFVWPLELTNT